MGLAFISRSIENFGQISSKELGTSKNRHGILDLTDQTFDLLNECKKYYWSTSLLFHEEV